MSPANTSSFSLIGIPSSAVSRKGSLLAGPQVIGELPAIVEVGPVVRLPLRDDRPALVVGGIDSDDVVEHPLDHVGDPIDQVATLGQHRRIVLVHPAIVGQRLPGGVGVDTDLLRPHGPGRGRRSG